MLESRSRGDLLAGLSERSGSPGVGAVQARATGHSRSTSQLKNKDLLERRRWNGTRADTVETGLALSTSPRQKLPLSRTQPNQRLALGVGLTHGAGVTERARGGGGLQLRESVISIRSLAAAVDASRPCAASASHDTAVARSGTGGAECTSAPMQCMRLGPKQVSFIASTFRTELMPASLKQLTKDPQARGRDRLLQSASSASCMLACDTRCELVHFSLFDHLTLVWHVRASVYRYTQLLYNLVGRPS